jgi:serine/threonine protein kinase
VAEALRPADPRWAGRYELIGRLGAGGMGEVYLGRSPGGRMVAVKVIKAELLAADPHFRTRFAREIAAARKVNALFTAPVVDADPEAETPWLVTAYVRGPSLAEAIDDHGPLRTSAVRSLAAGLAEGLAAIHAAGLVHRDLKPSNVLLASDGPRIIDFGISRAIEASALTAAGLFVGSPAYMSPEQAQGTEIGQPSDVFSLGAVLTFAATGHGPFSASSVHGLFYQVLTAEPALDGIAAELAGLIGRCLAKDPAVRPAPQAIIAELGHTGLLHDWLPPAIAATFVRYDLGGATTGENQDRPITSPEPPAATPPQTAPRFEGQLQYSQPPVYAPPPETRPPETRPPEARPPEARPPQIPQPYRAVQPLTNQRPGPSGRALPLPPEYRFGWLALPMLLLAGVAAFVLPLETYYLIIFGFPATVLASRIWALATRLACHDTTGLLPLAVRCLARDIAAAIGFALLGLLAIFVSAEYLIPLAGPGRPAAYRQALSASSPSSQFSSSAQAAYFLHLFLPLAVLTLAATVLLRRRADLSRPLLLPRAARLLHQQRPRIRLAAAGAVTALAVALAGLNGGLSPGKLPTGPICAIGHLTCEEAAHWHLANSK